MRLGAGRPPVLCCSLEMSPWQANAQRKADALAEKEQGNAAYKEKDFQSAVQHYDRALELFDGDISFLTNRYTNFHISLVSIGGRLNPLKLFDGDISFLTNRCALSLHVGISEC